VDAYYALSPPVAERIRRHEPLRLATRLLLTPVVFAVAYPWAALILGGVMIGWVIRRRRGRGETAG
jgi:hypothetical protein